MIRAKAGVASRSLFAKEQEKKVQIDEWNHEQEKAPPRPVKVMEAPQGKAQLKD